MHLSYDFFSQKHKIGKNYLMKACFVKSKTILMQKIRELEIIQQI